VIPGRLGQIEWYCDGRDCHSCPVPGEPALAVYTDRPRLLPRLWAVPGLRRWQTGDREMRAAFPTEALTPGGPRDPGSTAGDPRDDARPARGLGGSPGEAPGAYPRATSRPQDHAEAGTLLLDTSAGGPGARRMPEIPSMPRGVGKES
jgi:hypothetical protein